MNTSLGAFLFGLAPILVIPISQAQEVPNQSSETVFAEGITVELVEVEVFVRNKKGRPITDLQVEDFEVFENGQPVEITHFRLVFPPDKSPTPPAIVPSSSPDKSQVPPVAAAEALTPRKSLTVALFIDNANIAHNNRRRALRNLRDFVQFNSESADRFFVASFERSLAIRQPFTASKQDVLEKLIQLEEVGSFGVSVQAEFMMVLKEVLSPNVPEAQLEQMVRTYAQKLASDQYRKIRALRKTVDSMVGIEGRKALVYLSDGLHLNPGAELFSAMGIKYDNPRYLNDVREFDTSKALQSLAESANAAGVTLYTVLTSGVTAPLGSSAELQGSGGEILATVDSVRNIDLHGSGRLLAAETGGLALPNTKDFSLGYGRMVDDFNSYYSLAYQPPENQENQLHEIKVKVKRKKVEVRHRTGYGMRNATERMGDAVEAALLFGAFDNPFEITLAMDDSAREEYVPNAKERVVPIVIGIPMEDLVLLLKGDGYVGNVLLFIAVRDQEGNLSPTQEVSVPITVPSEALEQARGTQWTQKLKLRMKPGSNMVAVAVWDDLGKTGSTVTEQMEVKKR